MTNLDRRSFLTNALASLGLVAIPVGDRVVLAAFQYCTHVAIENCTHGALT